MFFFYLLSALFMGWSLGANNAGNIFGAAVETQMMKFRTAAIISAIFIMLGSVLEGAGSTGALGELGSVDAIGGAFTVSLSAALAITMMSRSGIPISINQTIVGAIVGWSLFTNRLLDYKALLTIASSWAMAIVLSAVFAMLLFYLVRPIINRSKLHLLRQDLFVRYGLVGVSAFGAYALGANNMTSIVGVFVPVSPFKDFSFGFFSFSSVQQLYFLGALSVAIGIFTYSHKTVRTVGKDIFQLSPVTALIAILAGSLVLFLFASRGLYSFLLNHGLPTIPIVSVSSTHVIVGAILGIGLAKGGKNVRYGVLGKMVLTWIIAPLITALVSFILLFIMQNVFEQKVQEDTHYVFNRHTLTQIEAEGYELSLLSTVNGRNYDTERQIYNELKAHKELKRPDIVKIIEISELYPLRVSIESLHKNRHHTAFSKGQLEILKQLEGGRFDHKWQLKNELEKHAEFTLILEPKNRIEKNYNKELESLFALMFSDFRYKEPKRR